MDAIELRLLLEVRVEDEELLARASPPAVATPDGGLTAPDDEMRVASVLGIVLTGLRDEIRRAAGIEIVAVSAEDLGRSRRPT